MSNLATIVNNILADSGIDDINVVVTTGSYANPAWITSLAWTKITGAPANIVTGVGTTNYLSKFTGASTIGNSIVFDNGTNVGIGTISPNARLSIEGGSNTPTSFGTLLVKNSSETGISFGASSTSYAWIQGNIYGSTYNLNLVLNAQGGNVGIGTTSPQQALHVNGIVLLENNQSIRWFNNASAQRTLLTLDSNNDFQVGGSISNIRFLTNDSSERMRIASNGNVGIGTTSPTTKFTVFGGYANFTDGTVDIYIGSDGNGGLFGTISNHYQRFITNNIERMRITNGGLVGIGTSAPAFQLDVARAGGLGIRVQNTSNTDDAYLQAQSTLGSALFGINATGQYLYNGTSIPILFYTNAVERMRILANGNVGIGTASPSVRLQVDNNTHNYFQLNSTVANVQTAISAQNTSSNKRATLSWEDGTRGDYAELYSSTFLAITTASSEKMRITSGGNVLIGTTSGYSNGVTIKGASDDYALTIAQSNASNAGWGQWADTSGNYKLARYGGGSYSSPALTIALSGAATFLTSIAVGSLSLSGSTMQSSGDYYIGTNNSNFIQFYTVNTERMRISETGNVGIGTTTAFSRLTVNGALSQETSQISLINSEGGHYIIRTGIAGIQNQGLAFISANQDGTGQTSRLVINSSGNVGIGTTSPTTRLEVSSSDLNNIFVTNPDTTGATTGSGIGFKAFNGSSVVQAAGIILTSNTWSFGTYSPNQLSIGSDGTGGAALRTANSAPITFFTGGTTAGLSTERMRITNNGNVGIGTTTSAWSLGKTLQIGGDNGAINFSGTSAILGIVNAYYNGSSYIHQNTGTVASFEYGLASANAFNWRMSPSANAGSTAPLGIVMSLTNAGNLGIGTPSPANTLHVAGIGRIDTGLYFVNGGTGGAFVWNIANESLRFGTNDTERMRITSSGNVGIGITNPQADLHVFRSGSTGSITTGLKVNHECNADDYVVFFTGNESTLSNRFVMTQPGNIGIGTSTPTGKLMIEATGNHLFLRASSATAGKYWNFDVTSANQLYILNNAGTQFFTMTDSGNFGIGTASPVSKLQVVGGGISIDADQPIRKAGDNAIISYSSSLPGISIGSGSATDMVVLNAGGTEKVRVNTSGNVGIGTTSPAGRLEVAGGSGSSGVQSYFSANAGFTAPVAGNAAFPGGAKIILWNDTGGNQQKASIGMDGSADIWFNNAGGQAGAGFTFYTGDGVSASPEARLKITKAGNVGIGTTTPLTALHVNDGVNVSNLTMLTLSQLGNTGNRDIVNLRMSFNNGNTPGTMLSSIKQTDASSDLSFSTGTPSNGALAERMRIKGSGAVGIGTTSPTSGGLLAVGGNIVVQDSNSSVFFGTAAVGYGDSGAIGRASTNGFHIINSTAGDLCIGAEYSKSILFGTGTSGTLSQRMRITSAGEVWMGYTSDQGAYLLQVNGAVFASSYFESSDARLKNITNTYNGLDFGAIQYTWKDGRDAKLHWGYAAQDVMKYIPDAVNENKDGFLSLDYNQAHTYKIAMLENRIAELEKQLNNK